MRSLIIHYFSQINMIRVVISRKRINLAWQREMRSAYRIMIGKPEETNQFGKPDRDRLHEDEESYRD
jgi:hypothetical protein